MTANTNTSAVKMLPESQAAEWPDEAAFRPCGWTSELSPREVADIATDLDRLDHDKEIDADSPALSLSVAERGDVLRHSAVLRQSWVTRPGVWRLAEVLVGPPEVDPFWNPWSHVHRLWSGVRLLDGNEGHDGFNLSLWGRVQQDANYAHGSRGRTAYVNGPHGDTAAYVRTCTDAARRGHRVAAVVALDGCGWFAGALTQKDAPALGSTDGPATRTVAADVLSCDVLAIPEGGRMSFEAPPGVKASSPTKGYALACWGVPTDLLERLFAESSFAVRVEAPDGSPWTLLLCAGDANRPTTESTRRRVVDLAKTT